MKTLESHLYTHPVTFSLDPKSILNLAKAVRTDVLDTVAEMARKYNTRELLEFADRVEALKSLP